jgi:hypothetical protein
MSPKPTERLQVTLDLQGFSESTSGCLGLNVLISLHGS